MTVVSGLRRLTGATTVVWLMPSKGAGWQGKPEFRALLAWIGDALRVMANAARSSVGPAVLEERPESPQAASAEDHDSGFVLAAALARMCIQIENIHTALDRLAAPRSMRQSIPLGAE